MNKRMNAREAKALKTATSLLSEVPVRGDPALVLDAIHVCVPVAAGLILTVNVESPDMMSGHAIRLPLEVVQGWMATPRAHFERAITPVIRSKDGDFWRADNLAASVRDRIGVLDVLDDHGLGEGAGYKVSQRRAPVRGTEHVSLALLTERKRRFDERAGALLKALSPAIRAAMARISLPLVATRPLVAQLMEDDEVGFIVVSKSGAVMELNRRAYGLVREIGISQGRTMLAEFAELALAKLALGARPWQIHRAGALLDVRRHDLRARAHAVPEDMILLTLHKHELALPGPRFSPPTGVDLSPRERDVAELLVCTGLTYLGIARRLSISPGTVRAIVPAIYRAYDVRTRDELVGNHLNDPPNE